MAKRISRTLFDLLAIGTRLPITRVMSTELSWWSDLDEQILGTVFLDTSDHDYGWALLVRDEVGQFRWAEGNVSIPSERVATAELRIAIANKSLTPGFNGVEPQGDERGTPLDLFRDRGVPDERLHRHYRDLRDRPGRLPARKVLEAISPWLITSDPHLVKEFQESQFDQRLWEIYLWAMFRDQGYDVRHRVAPDLKVTSPWFAFSIEATTVGPSSVGPLAAHPEPTTPEEIDAFLVDYMPMKFGSPLTAKLNKLDAQGRHYWEKEGVEDLPFVLAIADFHKEGGEWAPASMTYSQGGLYTYLYGLRLCANVVDGQETFHDEPVVEHRYNGKVVPSGFFNLPSAENVSAVLFSNAGTIAKFDRMGVLAGFTPEKHTYYRIGSLFDPDPDAMIGIPFMVNISDPQYDEYWGDEVQVLHNPRALRPLPPRFLPDAAHIWFRDGKLFADALPGRVLSSFTLVLSPQLSN
jgi:hypothetical protein